VPPPELQSAVVMQTPGVEPTLHWPLRVAWIGVKRASRRKGSTAGIAILGRGRGRRLGAGSSELSEGQWERKVDCVVRTL
jgi:hypothetical protein